MLSDFEFSGELLTSLRGGRLTGDSTSSVNYLLIDDLCLGTRVASSTSRFVFFYLSWIKRLSVAIADGLLPYSAKDGRPCGTGLFKPGRIPIELDLAMALDVDAFLMSADPAFP